MILSWDDGDDKNKKKMIRVREKRKKYIFLIKASANPLYLAVYSHLQCTSMYAVVIVIILLSCHDPEELPGQMLINKPHQGESWRASAFMSARSVPESELTELRVWRCKTSPRSLGLHSSSATGCWEDWHTTSDLLKLNFLISKMGTPHKILPWMK